MCVRWREVIIWITGDNILVVVFQKCHMKVLFLLIKCLLQVFYVAFKWYVYLLHIVFLGWRS